MTLGNPNDLFLGMFFTFLAYVNVAVYLHTFSWPVALIGATCGVFGVLHLWRYMKDIL